MSVVVVRTSCAGVRVRGDLAFGEGGGAGVASVGVGAIARSRDGVGGCAASTANRVSGTGTHNKAITKVGRAVGAVAKIPSARNRGNAARPHNNAAGRKCRINISNK